MAGLEDFLLFEPRVYWRLFALENAAFWPAQPVLLAAAALLILCLLRGWRTSGRWLGPVLGAAWHMNDQGWTRLTFRFGLFFAAMALLNELVWRTQSTDFWVSFKVFGIMGLSFLFILTQLPLLNRYRAEN